MILVLILTTLAWLLRVVSIVIGVAILLRMFMHWRQVNPFGWFAMKLRNFTEPFIRPLRMGFDSRMLRFDMVPIVAALIVVMNGFFAAFVIDGYASGLAALVTLGFSFRGIFIFLVSIVIYTLLGALIARFLMQQFAIGYSSRFYRTLYALTEPILKPFRRIFYFGGPFDISPMIAILAIQLVGWVLLGVVG